MTGFIQVEKPVHMPSYLAVIHCNWKQGLIDAKETSHANLFAFEVTDDHRMKFEQLADVEAVYIQYDDPTPLDINSEII